MLCLEAVKVLIKTILYVKMTNIVFSYLNAGQMYCSILQYF